MRRFVLVGLIALCAVPASAEVTEVRDSGFIVKLSAEAQASKSETWKTLIAPARWWSSEHTYSGDAGNLWLDAQATGCFCEKLPRPKDAPETQRIGSIEHMHVVYADPQSGVLRMSGGLGPLQQDAGNGTLTVTLKQANEVTRIDWVYAVSGLIVLKPEEIAPLVDQVLREQIERLALQATPPALVEEQAKARD